MQLQVRSDPVPRLPDRPFGLQGRPADPRLDALERLALESALQQALTNDEFVLHYQPRLAADEVIAEYAASDPFAARVYASIQEFRRKAIPWAKMTESVYYGEMLS